MIFKNSFKLIIRNKIPHYLQNRSICCSKILKNDEPYISEENIIREYQDLANQHLIRSKEHYNCLIIQPYIKWGPQKSEISQQEQMEEAVALIDTLKGWKVEERIFIPLDNFDRKPLFKSGSMQRIVDTIRKNGNISAVFVNLSKLKSVTSEILRENWGLPVFDRYKIIVHIFKMHAISQHAKLQVSLAELYYIRSNIRDYAKDDNLRLIFNSREQKLKKEITDLQKQRELLRHKRRKLNFPVVAVVGYTNAGKTSLIKCLTDDRSLEPRNQLFATLDVTAYSGFLPTGLEVLYIDTVGFISDIPDNLIQCFESTLEDAMLADVILIVNDISSEVYDFKKNVVLRTLKNLDVNVDFEKVVSVANKCDLVSKNVDRDVLLVSAKTNMGIGELKQKIEVEILKNTQRVCVNFKVQNGGNEIRWLYKNCTVLEQIPDEKNSELVNAKVIIDKANFEKFKHHFVNREIGK